MTAEALATLTPLVRQLLEQERETTRSRSPLAGRLSPALVAALCRLPMADLLAEIRRQRLVGVLAGVLSRLAAEPSLGELAAELRRLARHEARDALVLQHLTCRVAELFERAGQPLLVLKGIPLALQTTGSAIGRGGGDLDLLVPAGQLPAAVRLLESAGFVRPAGTFPRNLEGIWGRFSRWTTHELPLEHRGPLGLEVLDLHWSLAPVRQPLPDFSLLWRRSQSLEIQGQVLRTLGPSDALWFSAVHAMKEDWHTLRHLIDLDRLSRLLSQEERGSLRSHRLVRLSCGVAHACLGGPDLGALAVTAGADLRRALARSHSARSLPVPSRSAPGPWTLGRWLAMVARRSAMSRDPVDWLRTLLYFLVMPGAFNDPLTGADRGLLGMLAARRQRLRERLSG